MLPWLIHSQLDLSYGPTFDTGSYRPSVLPVTSVNTIR